MSHRLAVLISGSGTNLQAIINAINNDSLDTHIVRVISNRPEAQGLQRAQQAGISTAVVNHADYPDRDAFDRALTLELDRCQPDTVVLAGFMRVLTANFVRHYHGKLLNIHPSLLPRHRGLHTHQRALEAGDQEHGCSIHFVSEQLDGGPTIAQARLTVQPNDNEGSLSKRVQQQEHILFPLVLAWRAANRLRWTEKGVLLDDKLVPTSGMQVDTGHPDRY